MAPKQNDRPPRGTAAMISSSLLQRGHRETSMAKTRFKSRAQQPEVTLFFVDFSAPSGPATPSVYALCADLTKAGKRVETSIMSKNLAAAFFAFSSLFIPTSFSWAASDFRLSIVKDNLSSDPKLRKMAVCNAYSDGGDYAYIKGEIGGGPTWKYTLDDQEITSILEAIPRAAVGRFSKPADLKGKDLIEVKATLLGNAKEGDGPTVLLLRRGPKPLLNNSTAAATLLKKAEKLCMLSSDNFDEDL
ncbi:hypothetical protein DAPPUDRAFT_121168 [Daphnia pulex]|uniref:Uncharacterized protein n=1 Tax=Daphnia pulex TaxID=6669 RepID=E9I2U3_DAPPU|nr:hypothetical protein DAPPUDRAFT_121168 [Daphnia pulex]|eukprot:EFX61686.1 hypothetical protein DAPPUDRAFT_121168 [Daphnia pulex]